VSIFRAREIMPQAVLIFGKCSRYANDSAAKRLNCMNSAGQKCRCWYRAICNRQGAVEQNIVIPMVKEIPAIVGNPGVQCRV
jgi:hypothetical protein